MTTVISGGGSVLPGGKPVEWNTTSFEYLGSYPLPPIPSACLTCGVMVAAGLPEDRYKFQKLHARWHGEQS